MSRGTKSFQTKSGRIFEVSRELLGDDRIVEQMFRNAFVHPGCFQMSLDNYISIPNPSLVLEATKENKGWTIDSFELKVLTQVGEIETSSFCEKDERTCMFFPPNSVFRGLKFLISGRGQRWYKKEILRPFLEHSQAEVSSIIKRDIDFLILARANLLQENAKLAYAKKHGIQIISPRELMAIWFSEFQTKYPEELNVYLQTQKLGKVLVSGSAQSSKKSSRNQNESW